MSQLNEMRVWESQKHSSIFLDTCCKQVHKPMVLVFHKPAIILVFYKLNSAIGEGHEARRVGLKAVHWTSTLKAANGECQARLKIPPAPMHHLLQMADECQHRAAPSPRAYDLATRPADTV